MTSATVSVLASSGSSSILDVFVVAASLSGEKGSESASVRGDVVTGIADDLAAVAFTGKKDEVVRLPSPRGVTAKGIAVIGMGAAGSGIDELRYAAGTAARRIGGHDRLVLDFGVTSESELEAVLEGAGLGSYVYDDYRGTGRDDAPDGQAREIAVVGTGDADADARALRRARASVAAVALVRDLVNVPALDLYPSVYADRVLELAADRPITVSVWNEQELVAEGFGGIAGVGQGSTRPPRLVRVDYSPAGASRHIALVGKGITFDTGGLSLKPPVSMIGMKYDMAGSATVLATVLAAADLELPVHLTAWLCLAENMPSGEAIRPGDVLTIRGGRTVEVLNTDAEGRLVLADGLVAAGEEHPDAIIDVATLTGAAVVALGNRYVATMGDDGLVAEVLSAAAEVGETLWHMPLPAELRPLLASDIADIANVKPGNTAGGMLVAGVFLQEFVGTDEQGERIPWVHLDIAGAAQNKDAGYGFTVKGPTGATVRTLLRLAERSSRA